MKIVFTSTGNDWDSLIDERFGRAEKLVVFDEDTQNFEVIDNNTDSMEHGAGLQTIKKVIDLGADIVITGNGAGNKILDVAKQSNIKFYIGANNMTLKEAYQAYKDNKLQSQF
ncbi:MAG: dinitrogenase iron-molybdenum cofactor biosynthesis protein [Epsilonproteobacteria bacterium]|jgi:predicted Fe-Mo cluster-binding NifX family protein|nr:dinitrogenase iron-molybdenum cofactor biosynthesis protein [Campylobacterota bacterium]